MEAKYKGFCWLCEKGRTNTSLYGSPLGPCALPICHFQMYHFQIVPLPNCITSKLYHFQIVPLPNCTTSKLYHFQIVSLLNLLTVVIRGLRVSRACAVSASSAAAAREPLQLARAVIVYREPSAMASPLSSHSDSEEPCISRDQGMFCIA